MIPLSPNAVAGGFRAVKSNAAKGRFWAGSPRLLTITAAGKVRAARTIALPASVVVLLTLVSHGGNRHSPVVVDLKQRHIT
jgi:hypothetical protein